MLNNSSQRTLFWLLLISIFITIISWAYWKYFLVLTIWVLTWYMVEVMFFEDNMFMYELNYDFWREDNDTEW